MNLIHQLKSLFSKKQTPKELSKDELVVKATRGSTYAISEYGGALDKLAEYDRSS